MFKEYLHLASLTPFQKDQVKKFNNDSNIEYKQINNCEICQSSKLSTLFNNDRHGINQKTCICDECNFIFSNPRMKDRSIEYFYNSDLYRLMYSGKGILSEEKLFLETLSQQKKYKPSVPNKPNFNFHYDNLYFDFINSEIKEFDSVIDIGCGAGRKLIDFNFIGKKTHGIEPSRTYHKVHVELGLDCKIGFINDISEKYDLVILSHVFEHLTDLKKSVKKLHSITKKYLFIEVPGHVKKLQSIQNAHNYYFSLNTLNYFFLSNKFKLIKIDYARDNEFIYALYEKTDKETKFFFDKSSEKKIVSEIIRIYDSKYLIIKLLRSTGLEKIARAFYSFIKRLIKKKDSKNCPF